MKKFGVEISDSMLTYENEIRAAKGRINDIENKLSEDIAAVQSEAARRVVELTRSASSEIIPLRIFLHSMGADPSPIAQADSSTPKRSKSVAVNVEVTKARPAKTRSKGAASSAPKPRKKSGVSSQVALLTILREAGEPMDAASVDASMSAAGKGPASAKKERYLQFKNGLIHRGADEKLSLTDAGVTFLAGLADKNA